MNKGNYRKEMKLENRPGSCKALQTIIRNLIFSLNDVERLLEDFEHRSGYDLL